MQNMLTSAGLEPISRESIAEKVVHRILSLIKAGNLKAGDKLPSEKELMEVFNVSRPTLREALRALSILGVTKSRKGGGSYISELKAKDLLGPLEYFVTLEDSNLKDIFECRRILECEMVAKAAVNICDEELEEFERLIEVQRHAIGDAVAFRISDQKFHELLSTVSGNAVMARVADGMYNIGMTVRRQASEMDGVIAQSIEDHTAIVEALRKKDPNIAREAMDKHLINIENSTRMAAEYKG